MPWHGWTNTAPKRPSSVRGRSPDCGSPRRSPASTCIRGCSNPNRSTPASAKPQLRPAVHHLWRTLLAIGLLAQEHLLHRHRCGSPGHPTCQPAVHPASQRVLRGGLHRLKGQLGFIRSLKGGVSPARTPSASSDPPIVVPAQTMPASSCSTGPTNASDSVPSTLDPHFISFGPDGITPTLARRSPDNPASPATEPIGHA